ncbi:MAG: LPS assembly protein LptD [Anaerobiospirillum succiniciproducens]|uniref:LPS-assembly protein LptD n=1 Tax=Anaerobiospirillum succiniciproducens TaxID=13335 RepID=UPI002357939F|nr:LPS assembly protein LptD [Anaerobiospirillum succiniciproducens]MCI6862835.1 LPS assembly protein LptD [Anaerobiospirillum succiniciproducens]MDY2798391.1 LPS assembly protein LptD [Anaerobiospirillum succiniciproducens]
MRQHKPHLKVSALAFTLTCILYGQGAALANEQARGIAPSNQLAASGQAPTTNSKLAYLQQQQSSGIDSDSIDPVEKAKLKRLNSVTEFADNIYGVMVKNIATQQYLSNRQLAAASTFPLRLISTLSKNPWRPSPFMPVPERDMECYYGIPAYSEPQNFDLETTPVNISANEVTASGTQNLTYSGNVTVSQGDRLIKADEAVYDGDAGTLVTSGNISIHTPQLTINSPASLESNLKSNVSTFSDASFQLNGSVARGSSKLVTVNNEQKSTEVEDFTFTTCPVGDNSWYFKAGSVELDQNDSFGESYHNVLYVKDVPVLYLPYLNFPTTNRRKSGLLYPSVSISSNNGADYEQPIYWSIASNYDYTFTPRLMSKRGLLLGNEFRYMPIENSIGTFIFDYIPNDNDWALSENFDDDSRYFFRWKHTSSFFNNDLTFDIDYQRVRNGDYDYLDDLGAKETNVTDDHLKQSLKAAYDRPDFHIQAEARDYQRLQPDTILGHRPFSMLPQISGQYYSTVGSLTLNFNGEMTRFSSSSDSRAQNFEATRIHFEPEIGMQLFNMRGTSVDASLRGFFTHYSQDSIEDMPDYYRTNLGFTELDSSVNRALYLAQIKAKTTLERKVLDLRHTQTFEPEVLYQYIPYEDQSNIALYDTTDRMSDYYSNFSFRNYTGKDRIADINAITMGVTSRLLDPHDREIVRFGVSQTYSFNTSKVTLAPRDPINTSPRSPMAMFFNAEPVNGLTLHAGLSYDTEEDNLKSWNAMTQYKNENGLLVQVGYRFADKGNRSLANDLVDLSQLGLVTSVPINEKISVSFAAYNDLEQNEDIDTKAAIKFEDCCWSLSFVYENYNSCDWDSLKRERDHIFGIQFEFKGAGAVNVTGDFDRNFTDTRLLKHFDPTDLNR